MSDAPRVMASHAALLVDAKASASMCGVGVSMWWKLKSSGRCPDPVRVGRRRLWRVDELREWVAAGCPPKHKKQSDQYRLETSRNLETLNLKTKTAGL